MADHSELARDTIINAARTIVTDLTRAFGPSAADARVTTPAATFHTLAGLLDRLAADATACGGSECMGRKVDGMRLWVAMDRLDAEKRRCAELEQDNARLRAAAAQSGRGSRIDGPVDIARLEAFGETMAPPIPAPRRAADPPRSAC